MPDVIGTIDVRDVFLPFGIKALGGDHLCDTLPDSYCQIIPFRFNQNDDWCLQMKLGWRQTYQKIANAGQAVFGINIKVNPREKTDAAVEVLPEFNQNCRDDQF